MRQTRIVISLLAPLLLGSCSIIYPVKAFFLGGQLAFVSEDLGMDPRWCRFSFKLLDGDGRHIWSFEQSKLPSGDRCRDNSPLIYGQVPTSVEVTKPAQQLRVGTIYVIDGNNLEGAFTIYRGGGKLIVRNLPANSEEVSEIRSRGWRSTD